ncbi:MAG: hypothetical protein FWB74_00540 [Defluviitaleaceae bacterium]|nr:hypothetical protein [Defluviitaleaceae bacterium]
MNTDTIKNICIGVLSGFILLFAVLIINENRAYTLTASCEENVRAILERGGITIERAALPRDFRPMQTLAMQTYSHDITALAARFFGDIPFYYEYEIGSSFYFCDISGKEIEHNNITRVIDFSMEGGFFTGIAPEEFTKTAAGSYELARGFITNILLADDLYLSSNALTPNGDYQLVFFASYQGNIIYNTQLRMRVTEQGIVRATYQRVATGGFDTYPRPIFSADEALLALLNHLRTRETDRPAEIVNIRLVYAFTDRGIPAYLFTVVIDDMHINFRFSALTNTYIGSAIIL